MHAAGRGAGREVLGGQVVGVLVCLQAVLDLGERDAVHQRCRHQVGAEVDQQLIVDQGGGAAAKAAATPGAGLPAVVAVAERVGVALGGGGAQEAEFHVLLLNDDRRANRV